MIRQLIQRSLFIGIVIIGSGQLARAQDREDPKDLYQTLGLPRFGADAATLARLKASSWNDLVDHAYYEHKQYLTRARSQMARTISNPKFAEILSKDPRLSAASARYDEMDLQCNLARDILKNSARKMDYDRTLLSSVIKNAKTKYDVLGVSKDATKQEIDSAYSTISQTLRAQPKDKQSEAIALLTEVNKAYVTFKDPHTQWAYDSSIENEGPTSKYERLLLTEGEVPPRLLLKLKREILFKGKKFLNNRFMESGGNLGFVGGAMAQLCGKAFLEGDPDMLKVCTDEQFDLNNVVSLYAFSIGNNFGTPILKKIPGLPTRLAGPLGMPFGSFTSHYYDKFFSFKEQKIFWDNFREWRYEEWAKQITNRDLIYKNIQMAIYDYTESGYDKKPDSPQALKAQADLEALRQQYWQQDNQIEPFRKAWLQNLGKAMYETIHTDKAEWKELGTNTARMFATVGTIELFKYFIQSGEAKYLLKHQDQIKVSMPEEKVGKLIEYQRQIDESKKILAQYPELQAQAQEIEEAEAKSLFTGHISSEYQVARDFLKGSFKNGTPPAEDVERQILFDGWLNLKAEQVAGLPKKYLPENIALPVDEWLMKPAAKLADIAGKIKSYLVPEDITESDLTFSLKTRMKVGQFSAAVLGGAWGAIPFLTLDQVYQRTSNQAITATELEGKIKPPLIVLNKAAKAFVLGSDRESAFTQYSGALDDYYKAWEDYRTKVVLAQYNEHYSYFQKLEEKITGDANKKITYITWLKEGANENDEDFLMNGQDPSTPTPPWHSDPKFKETFEKEKAYYRSLVKDWDDDALADQLNEIRLASKTAWTELRKVAVVFLLPIMKNSYFNAQTIPFLEVYGYSIAGNFVPEVRNTWDLAKDLFNDAVDNFIDRPKTQYDRIALPTNAQDSYIEQLNILETYCAQIMSDLPLTELTVNLGVLCSKGVSSGPDFITFVNSPLVSQNPVLVVANSGDVKSIIDPQAQADLLAIGMAENLAKTVEEMGNLQYQYNSFKAKTPEEHLPSKAELSERAQKVAREILGSRTANAKIILHNGGW